MPECFGAISFKSNFLLTPFSSDVNPSPPHRGKTAFSVALPSTSLDYQDLNPTSQKIDVNQKERLWQAKCSAVDFRTGQFHADCYGPMPVFDNLKKKKLSAINSSEEGSINSSESVNAAINKWRKKRHSVISLKSQVSATSLTSVIKAESSTSVIKAESDENLQFKTKSLPKKLSKPRRFSTTSVSGPPLHSFWKSESTMADKPLGMSTIGKGLVSAISPASPKIGRDFRKFEGSKSPSLGITKERTRTISSSNSANLEVGENNGRRLSDNPSSYLGGSPIGIKRPQTINGATLGESPLAHRRLTNTLLVASSPLSGPKKGFVRKGLKEKIEREASQRNLHYR